MLWLLIIIANYPKLRGLRTIMITHLISLTSLQFGQDSTGTTHPCCLWHQLKEELLEDGQGARQRHLCLSPSGLYIVSPALQHATCWISCIATQGPEGTCPKIESGGCSEALSNFASLLSHLFMQEVTKAHPGSRGGNRNSTA